MSGALFEIEPAMGEAQPAQVPAFTEREMLDLLHKRFGFIARNGGTAKPRYVKAEHVRARAGFFERGDIDGRTADFVAVDTWTSSRFAVHGVEVKVSRSDWLRELKDPSKAEAVRAWSNFWWLAVPHRSVVRDDELPAGWGLLTGQFREGRWCLRAVVQPVRTEVPPIPPESVVSLLYAVAKTAAARGAA